MEIVLKKLDEIKPYEKNPRKNDNAVEYVMNSIKEFGFKVPIVIDKDGIIVAGHTRYKASQKLGLKEVPCIIADDLSDEQIKAFRLADNKVSEKAEWDYGLLDEEIKGIFDINMEDFGFINFDVDSFIDELMDKQDQANFTEKDKFSITFIFDKKNEEAIMKYIKENGKESIVHFIEDLILEGE